MLLLFKSSEHAGIEFPWHLLPRSLTYCFRTIFFWLFIFVKSLHFSLCWVPCHPHKFIQSAGRQCPVKDKLQWVKSRKDSGKFSHHLSRDHQLACDSDAPCFSASRSMAMSQWTCMKYSTGSSGTNVFVPTFKREQKPFGVYWSNSLGDPTVWHGDWVSGWWTCRRWIIVVLKRGGFETWHAWVCDPGQCYTRCRSQTTISPQLLLVSEDTWSCARMQVSYILKLTIPMTLFPQNKTFPMKEAVYWFAP